ncbi:MULTISPECIES: class II aldolase/adducin family protein [Escherichia]|uniref:class II aldolase/adducin family protein n=1 Tax=Escherichia TaxID=561 RepID=UPI0007E43705|nr:MULTISPECIES: class II aldolase/adducin family protein [Escherichia]MEC9496483.1 class II aldolase/adducin family protein [Escherichia whittamii]MEC9560585.1 class II aldolase/adducin family protein [Escherichia whittamii]QLX45979.1 class II aldolase/adducin family protein [Escherichia coli]
MLEILKQQVVEMAKTTQLWGMCKHKAGNTSVRDPETGLICVTPTTVDKNELTVRDIVVLSPQGDIVENLSGLRPTSECMMHLQAYRTRPDIHAICHTHSRFASIFAALEKSIPAVIYECAILNLQQGIVPVAPFALPGTQELALSIIEPLQQSDAILLGRHGAMTVDVSSYDAVLKSAYLEELAEIYYHMLLVNGLQEPKVFSGEDLARWSYPQVIR